MDVGEKTERTNIGLREVRKLGPNQTIWDAKVRGFGARRRETKAVYYFVRYRTQDGRQRVLAIGVHDSPWAPDEAREEAEDVLREVRKGGDPAVAISFLGIGSIRSKWASALGCGASSRS